VYPLHHEFLSLWLSAASLPLPFLNSILKRFTQESTTALSVLPLFEPGLSGVPFFPFLGAPPLLGRAASPAGRGYETKNKISRRANSEADFARSGVVSNNGRAFSAIPRLGSGLLGLFHVVVADSAPFSFIFWFHFWAVKSNCFGQKPAFGLKLTSNPNPSGPTRRCTSG
jgi:hypothetical protein